MKILLFFLFTAFLFTGCASTHTLLVYKLKCNVETNFLNKEINENDFRFYPDPDYKVCDKFKSFKIVRKNIIHKHLDGRSFKMEKVERSFYVDYDKSKCELLIVTPLTGRVPDTTDSNYISNKYYYAPLISKLTGMNERDIKFSSEKSFDTEGAFKSYCNTKE